MSVTVMKEMNFQEIRHILTEEVEKLRRGKSTHQTLGAISNAFGKYLSSVKLQLEVAKALGHVPSVGGLLPEPKANAKGRAPKGNGKAE